ERDHRAGHARARLLAADPRRRALHPGGPRGPHDGPRLLPLRLLPGLHGPAAGLRGGPGRAARARRRPVRRLHGRPGLPAGVQGEARHLDRAALRLRAQGRHGAQVRRLLRARGHDEPRAGHRRPGRGRVLVAPGRLPGRPARREPHLRRPRGDAGL
ncbi:MAG: Alkyl hydroperoxide reductase subunit C-like protein, partial [uncultured Solirubrobacteraceae bacterium]